MKIQKTFYLAAAICLASLTVRNFAFFQLGNSSRITRVTPNKISQRIGSAVDWKFDLESALTEARKTGKPIFWYVPSLPDTFMDRKQSVHRYMLAGPFSWPRIIETLNQNAVCLNLVPSADQQAQYDLQRYQYVEPGFVVLDSRGQKTAVVDQLTTLHPQWLLALVQKTLGVEINGSLFPKATESVWDDIGRHDYDHAQRQASQLLLKTDLPTDTMLSLELARGVAEFGLGNQDTAKHIWTSASQRHPDHPFAWKLAAEGQGFGPFVRGFETFSQLPASAMQAAINSRGSAAPTGTYTLDDIRQRGVSFLLSMQHRDGGFYDSDYDFGGTDSVKNVHVAVSSLAGLALLRQSENLQETADSPLQQQNLRRAAAAIDATIRFVSDDKNLNKNDRDEIFWAYAFRLRFLTACKSWLLDRPVDSLAANGSPDVPAINLRDYQGLIQRCIGSLESIQTNRGGWYHEYANPFVTANAILALQEARASGYTVSDGKLFRGSESLLRDRFQDGSFSYSTSQRDNSGQLGGQQATIAAAGRMPLCELALLRVGKSNQAKLIQAIEESFTHHAAMHRAYKYDNHTDNYAYGGFFFWYDMRSRTEAIQSIADPQQRQTFVERQRQLIMALPEVDGCFVDSHELGRVYGTAMALICLDRLQQ